MADDGNVIMPRPYIQTFPNHGCQILDQLNVQRYYGNFCDVVVRVDDADFKVHRSVLAASSSKLQALMYSIQQDSSDVLSLKDLSLNGFKAVVEYMYTGVLRLDAVSVQEVLVASQYLELREVEKACLEFYKSTGAEAPLPPLEAALGLVRMSGLGATSGLQYQAMQQMHQTGNGHSQGASQEPVMVILPNNQPVPDSQRQGAPDPRQTEHSNRLPSTSVVPPPPSPQPPQLQQMPPVPGPPVGPTHVNAPLTGSTPMVQPTLNPQVPSYVGPNSSMAIDTNYIEDYLKIIESIQEQNPPQLESQEVPPPQDTTGAVPPQDPPSLAAVPKLPTNQGNLVASSSEFKDARLQQHPSQVNLHENSTQGVSNVPPPIAVVNPRTAGSNNAPSFNTNPTSSTYSAEEVRRTILSVLSQEKFDDDDDDGSKEKEQLPLTSLLNIQPLSKRDGASTSHHARETLPMTDDNMDDVPLDMQMADMDGSSDSDPEPPETISEMSSDRDELHIHIPETPEEAPAMSCLPLPEPPQPQSQLQVPMTENLGHAQNSPEPKTGGPLILRIKRRQWKGMSFDFGDLETMSTTVAPECTPADGGQVGDLQWKREGAPASDWTGGGAGTTSAPSTSSDLTNVGSVNMSSLQVEKNNEFVETQPCSTQQLPLQGSFVSYGNSVTEGNKSYVQMKPPQPTMSYICPTGPPPPIQSEPEKVSTCPKPFKKRLPNRSKPPVRKPGLSCEKCGREFDKVESLQKHMDLHNTDTNNIVYSCHVCGFKYNRPGELTRHMRKHSAESFICHICSADFREPRLYRRHMQTMHDIAKPFACSYPGCNFSGDKLSHVEKHRTIHSGVKAFECPKCSKGFSQINGLRSHLKSCFQRRGYECRVCMQKFNHLQSMKSHMLLHSGEKPHICEDCGAKFADHRNFKRHRRIHENTFPYACCQCGKKFRHSNSLKAHENIHQKGTFAATPGNSNASAASDGEKCGQDAKVEKEEEAGAKFQSCSMSVSQYGVQYVQGTNETPESSL